RGAGVLGVVFGVVFGGVAMTVPAPAAAQPEGGPSVSGERTTESSAPASRSTSEPGAGPGRNPGPVVRVALKLRRDGALLVTEQVTTPRGSNLTKRMSLRTRVETGNTRTYEVHDVRTTGSATADVSDGELTVRTTPGSGTVRYTVAGAVADRADRQEVRWLPSAGWQDELDTVYGTFVAPDQAANSMDCFVTGADSEATCDMGSADHSGVFRFSEAELDAGERVEVAVGLPAGTVPPNARVERNRTLADAFALSTPVGIGFGVLAVLLLAGVVTVWWLRNRDVRGLSGPAAAVDMLAHHGGRTSFASPDGLLPGQIGTVIDGAVDPVDISATVVALAA